MRDAEALILAEDAARRAGAMLRERFAAASTLSAEGRDIKLFEDSASQDLIVERLAGSGLPVLAEEQGARAPEVLDAPAAFVVDPLDGSFNFSRGLDYCAVAIALLRGGAPSAGVIYDFLRDRLYAGAHDVSARCNGAPMRVSQVRERGQAVLATGFPVNRDYSEAALKSFAEQMSAYKKIRMIGSAASSLALVAAGIVDVYHEENIMLWDVAAGLAIVEAAGGAVKTEPSRSIPRALTVTAASCTDLL
ncbi:MAG: inositol monophosphatase [Maricaulaceae bacterium]|jgi:myo-inositol-1(or 4)-monophosphatase